MNRNTHTLFILLTILTFWRCQKEERGSVESFINQPKYKGDFFSTVPFHSPDSAVLRIQQEVPPLWYGSICEGLYYHLPEGTSDSIILRYIDLFEQKFAHDTVFTFTKTLRGKLFLHQDRYDTAMACLVEAYNYSVKINSPYRMGDAKKAMGELYTRQSNYPEAIKSLLEAYQLYSKIELAKKNGALFETIIGIGNAYRGGNDYVSAQVWYQRLLDFARQRNESGSIIAASTAIAENYWHLNQLDSAKMMIDTVFYYQNRYYNFYDQAYRYFILAQIRLAQGHCNEALGYFHQAKQKNLKVTDLIRVNLLLEGLGDGYKCIGRLDSAVWYYQQALATPDIAHQAIIMGQLSKIYAQQGHYKLAYQQEQKSRQLSNKIFTTEKNKSIGRLQAENEFERRERHLSEELYQIKTGRLVLVIGLLILSILVLIGRNQIMEQKQEKQVIETEKALIEAREQLKIQALLVAEQALKVKDRELEESNKQLDLKDLIIQKLEMKLTDDKNGEKKELDDKSLQDLKILTTEDWRRFRGIFEQQYPYFILNLVERYPKLSGSELRILVLIKIGFDSGEMANVLGISPASVYTNRYRLRKKLCLVSDDDLERFVQDF